MGLFKYSRWDFVFTCLGLVFLLYDIVSDILAVRTFYEEKAYLCLCIMVVLLLGSSVLVQAFSWLWYSYEDYERETTVEKIPSVTVLKLLHVLQLGIYIRLYMFGMFVECFQKSVPIVLRVFFFSHFTGNGKLCDYISLVDMDPFCWCTS